MIGRIMGCGDRAKGFSVAKEDGLALLDLLGEEDVDSFHDKIPLTQCFLKAPTTGWMGGGWFHRQQLFQQYFLQSLRLKLIDVLMLEAL